MNCNTVNAIWIAANIGLQCFPGFRGLGKENLVSDITAQQIQLKRRIVFS